MEIINIHEAKTHLSQLIASIEEGNEIIIGRAGKPVAKLIPYAAIPPKRTLGGSWEGKIWVADDFDVLPEEFIQIFEGDDEATS